MGKNKMKKRRFAVRSRRLTLYPLSEAEMDALIEETADGDLKEAYLQMREASQNDPDRRIWYVPWAMEQREDQVRVGEVGFHGAPENNAVEIGYGIRPQYEGQGYTQEAVRAMTDWALTQEDICFVEAEAAENTASAHILEKLGFARYGKGEEGVRYEKEKPLTSYASLGMCLGMCFGMSLGMCMFRNNFTVGMCMGMCLGMAIGSGKDKREKQKRSEIKAKRKARLSGKV